MLYVDHARHSNGLFDLAMEDVHKEFDDRELPIDFAGVDRVRYPIVVRDREGKEQHTVAQLSMAVSLPHNVRGTHMSRFIEVLSEYQGAMTFSTLPEILCLFKEVHGAGSARIELSFPFFLEREAPVSKKSALMEYESSFYGEVNGDRDDFKMRVRVPVCALCPCSKKISDYGAHNQRGQVTIEVWPIRTDIGTPMPICLEDLIEYAERSGSAPVYPLLKRPDERYVTMQAYDNPKFVEDIARTAAAQLNRDARVAKFSVHVENFESIHSHTVFASIDWTR